MLAPRYPLLAPWLRRYFYSGWAFLMPYLFAYLLYYVTKWPVNPVGVGAGSQEAGGGIAHAIVSPSHALSLSHSSFIPCLLHVYWALHAIHVILAGVALWSWWKHGRAKDQGSSAKCQVFGSQSPSHSLLPLSLFSDLPVFSLLPWLLLALIFYIPGVYLEWPSDPWEHLRRINEWRILETVGAHSSWLKSSYFIPYSFLSWCIGLRQLFWLDFYYTGICLLLCWQYYRFSRACGLGERASMVFVIIQALLFGNNIFSFYRYYGISSSIYAQLGAVALTRIVLEFAAKGTKLETILQEETKRTEPKPELSPLPLLTPVQTDAENTNSQKIAKDTKSGNFVGPSLDDAPSAIPVGPHLACPPVVNPGLDARSDPKSEYHCTPFSHFNNHLSFWHLPSLALLLSSSLALFLLTAFNHPQGLGIAGLGILAVIVWRLIEWKRSTLWWLIVGTLLINALFLWLYPHPLIIETYRAQGYLNAWYGFNILNLASPAGDRMLQIVSIFGLVNLAAALVLLRRNHVAAWLTIMPAITLLMPSIGVLFANTIAKQGDAASIIIFQRMFFAIPLGLALVRFYALAIDQLRPGPGHSANERPRFGIPYITVTSIALSAFTALSSTTFSYNRTWHALTRLPLDLRMNHILAVAESPPLSGFTQVKLITSFPTGTALHSAGLPNVVYACRTIGVPTSSLINPVITAVTDDENYGDLLYIPAAINLYTPVSQAGQLSRHWPQQVVAVDLSAGPELAAAARRADASKIFRQPGTFYKFRNR